MAPLQAVSLLSPIAYPLQRDVLGYLSKQTNLPFVEDFEAPWETQATRLADGAAALGFICGLLYVRHGTQRLDLLAAPVPAAPRYAQQPIYFSDLIVAAGSPFRSLADLRGARWAYNEPGSFSGFVVVRAHLAAQGCAPPFFGSAIAAGSHLAAIDLVLEGAADCAAIDSTVLDATFTQRPDLSARLRSVAQLGPNPVPPIVAGRHLPHEQRLALRTTLLEMHADPHGAALLKAGGLLRFASIADRDYHRIRYEDALSTAWAHETPNGHRPHHQSGT